MNFIKRRKPRRKTIYKPFDSNSENEELSELSFKFSVTEPISRRTRHSARLIKPKKIFDPTEYDAQHPANKRTKRDKKAERIDSTPITTLKIRLSPVDATHSQSDNNQHNEPVENFDPDHKSASTTTASDSGTIIDSEGNTFCINCKRIILEVNSPTSIKCDSCTNRVHASCIINRNEKWTCRECNQNIQYNGKSQSPDGCHEISNISHQQNNESVIETENTTQIFEPNFSETNQIIEIKKEKSPQPEIFTIDDTDSDSSVDKKFSLTFQSINVSDWTTKHVNQYFTQVFVEYPKIKEAISRQEIDGMALLELTREDCIKYFGLSLGNAIRLFCEIQKLKKVE